MTRLFVQSQHSNLFTHVTICLPASGAASPGAVSPSWTTFQLLAAKSWSPPLEPDALQHPVRPGEQPTPPKVPLLWASRFTL